MSRYSWLSPNHFDVIATTLGGLVVFYLALLLPLGFAFGSEGANPLYGMEVYAHALNSLWAVPFALGLPILFYLIVFQDMAWFHGFFMTLICQCICMAAYDDMDSYLPRWVLVLGPGMVYWALIRLAHLGR